MNAKLKRSALTFVKMAGWAAAGAVIQIALDNYTTWPIPEWLFAPIGATLKAIATAIATKATPEK
jgi:hypothetical protein